jgi:hypothetical protein
MVKKKTQLARVPVDMLEEINKSLDIRFKNNLISRKDLKLPEGFRLIKRMPEWNLAMEKLRMFPKKEDTK